MDLGLSHFWGKRISLNSQDGDEWGQEILGHREVLRVDILSGHVRAVVMRGPYGHHSQGRECEQCPLEFRNKLTLSQRQGTGSVGEAGRFGHVHQ